MWSQNMVLSQTKKVRAVLEMVTPTEKQAVQRFVGVIQYPAKFIPILSEVSVQLRKLLIKDVEFNGLKNRTKVSNN